MIRAVLLVSLSVMAFAQEEDLLPDRDDLVKKIVGDEYLAGTRELLEFFQLGGVRTVFRNFDKMDAGRAREYAEVFRYLDLFRFRNDLNNNLQNATSLEMKGINLMLLASFGRSLEPTVFLPFVENDKEDITLRLAAASGLVKVQKVQNYDLFLATAKDAEIDPGTGRDDFRYADIHSDNQGFFYYSLSKITADEPPHNGHIMTVILLSNNSNADAYVKILDLKRKKYIPLMIDHAVRVGGVALLDAMESHKTCKKNKDEIAKAKAAAGVIAQYQSKFMASKSPGDYPIGALLPTHFGGSGSGELPSAYVIVKVDTEGAVTVVEALTPFGGSPDAIQNRLPKTTVPAYSKWKADEFYSLMVSP
ncbi:MAG: hypothetical protein H6510_11570 [Acidobacteria bacterium]|nr:hypothetical protein [Acidobacteriota bacterium]